MNDSDFQRLEEAFGEAVELDEAAREAYVARFRERHPALAARLVRMLDADARGEDTLKSFVADETASFSGVAGDPWIGRTLGAWTIRERIGAGGMGAVFLADRSDSQFEQTVAIKVMSAQLLSESAADRFLFERQTLANLRHPNIATLLDGGSTELNIPYLVMEHVAGVPIDDYCAREAIGLRERLALFRKVCAAVNYAHRNLIVHRDLKPDNILVDETGEPKLLDFGVAKLIEPQRASDGAASGHPHTQAGARVMTLEYASPEQVKGEPVSVATDIYALGVLLYKLLTGQSPYSGTLSTARQYEDAILSQEPRAPSATQPTLTSETSESPTAASNEDWSQFRKRLQGDLDNIVFKCLQKDPDRRYASALDLADDIRRFLNNEPVEARRAGFLYVAGKFVARNAAAVAATVAVAAIFTGIVGYYTYRLAEERDVAQTAAAEARLAASEAEEVSGFLASILHGASPHNARGQVITAFDLLNSGVERIEELAGQPVLQSRLYGIMGITLTDIGEFERGLALSKKSVEVLEGVEGADPVLLADNLAALAEGHRVLEQNEESITVRRRAYALYLEHIGAEHPDTIFAKIRLGTSLATAGRTDEALAHLREATATSRKVSEGYNAVLLDGLGVGAVNLSNMGRYRDAEEMNAEAIEHSKVILGDTDPNTVIRIRNSGVFVREQYRFEDALALQEDALARSKGVWPDQSSQTTYGLHQMAITMRYLGRFDEAWRLMNAVEPDILAGDGKNSLHFAFHAETKGWILLDEGRYEEAFDAFNEAYEIAVGLNGEVSRRAVDAAFGMGEALAALDRLDEAEGVFRAALANAHVTRVHAKIIGQRAFARVLSRRGAHEEADALYRAIVEEKASHVGADSAALAPILAERSVHERRKGDVAAALRYASRAHELAQRAWREGNWMRARIDAAYAAALNAAGEEAMAARVHREALAAIAATFHDGHPLIAALEADFLN